MKYKTKTSSVCIDDIVYDCHSMIPRGTVARASDEYARGRGFNSCKELFSRQNIH